MKIYVKKAVAANSGKGMYIPFNDIYYYATFEVWVNYGIKNINQLNGKIILLDENKEIRRKGAWAFLNAQNIISISETEDISADIQKEINIQEDKTVDNYFKPDHEISEMDLTKTIDINFETIYDGVDFYKIGTERKSVSKIEKLIEKSIKLTKVKYNNGVVDSKNDYNFGSLLSLAGKDLVGFVHGNVESLTIDKPKMIQIPEKYKTDKKGAVEYLRKLNDSFMVQSDDDQYIKGRITTEEYVGKINKRKFDKFNKLDDLQKRALKIEKETGISPLAIAWPFVKGKTDTGSFIHAPIAYQLFRIEESLNAFKLIKTSTFQVNSYPILKNYVDTNGVLNQIEKNFTNLRDLLIHFYKHGIKITKPDSNEMSDYRKIDDFDNEVKFIPNKSFTLSNEMIIKIKPHDEYIYYDLRKIQQEYKEFSVPESNKKLFIEKEELLERNFIIDVDDSKARAIVDAVDESSVIFGPPGTGKSATITAIVGEIIRKSKSSIMVAEKSTALEVIEENLRKHNLDSFVVNLNNDSKIDFQKKFKKQIDLLTNTKTSKVNIEELKMSEIWLNENELKTQFYNLVHSDNFAEFFEQIERLEWCMSQIGYEGNDMSEFVDLCKEYVSTYEEFTAIKNSTKTIAKNKLEINKLSLELDVMNKDKMSMLNDAKKVINDELENVKNDISSKVDLLNDNLADVIKKHSDKRKMLIAEFISSANKVNIVSKPISIDDNWFLVNHKNISQEEIVARTQFKKPSIMALYLKINKAQIKELLILIDKVNFEISEHDGIKNKSVIEINEKLKNLSDEKTRIISSLNDEYKNASLKIDHEFSRILEIKNVINDKTKEINSFDKKINSFNMDEVNFGKMICEFFSKDDLDVIDIEKVQFYVDNRDSIDMPSDEMWKAHLELREKYFANVRKYVVNKFVDNFRKKTENDVVSKKIINIKKFVENKLSSNRNSIEGLFASESEVLKLIFPCLMMSPDIVSRIFSIEPHQFDYAIFDEASQIRLHRALPTIHRAKHVIVAGDDKQLGPTDLFTNIVDDTEEEFSHDEEADLDNKTLLNFAKDKYNGIKLETHYRSKGKDLIEFSNKTFYNGTIQVADTPLSRYDGSSSIVVEEIGGLWQEDRTNIEEANRAVELAKYYLIDQNKSLAIITFNSEQMRLIEKKLLDSIELNPFRDNYFVKPIKDVQGDEKDVVIFSITYGKRSESKQYVSMFGKLSKEKINVAITRAKYRMHVLKSLPSTAVAQTNDDYRVFKEWLRYIEEKEEEKNDFTNYKNNFRSQFEKDYFDILKELLPIEIIPLANYNVGPKEIDVVLFSTIENKFIGAIELDGIKYHSTREQLINDYERQLFLENLGWKFVRTTPPRFYANRKDSVIDDLFKHGIQAKKQTKVTRVSK